jgi:hypothetical protein
MASEVKGKPVAAVPDMRVSAARLKEAIQKYYQDTGAPVSPQASDVLGLAERLAAILAPLYEDIRDTFAAYQHAAGGHAQLAPGQA